MPLGKIQIDLLHPSVCDLILHVWNSRRNQDRNFLLEAISTQASVLKHLPLELRGDEMLVLAAIPHSGFILGFAAEELRNKKSFVLQAVKINGYALMGASDVGP